MDKNISEIINEVLQDVLNEIGENQEPMDFSGLAEMIGRMYPERSQEMINVFARLLEKEYQKSGDAGVMKMFRGYAGIPIKSTGDGNYVFDYSDIQSSQIKTWNYKHPGD